MDAGNGKLTPGIGRRVVRLKNAVCAVAGNVARRTHTSTKHVRMVISQRVLLDYTFSPALLRVTLAAAGSTSYLMANRTETDSPARICERSLLQDFEFGRRHAH